MIRAKIKTVKKSSIKKELMRKIGEADNRSVKVGFPSNGVVRQGRKSNTKKSVEQVDIARVIEYAAYNHFGTRDGRIPSRPFMTTAFTGSNKAALDRLIKKEVSLIIDPKRNTSVEGSLRRLGVQAVSLIRKSITDMRSPANSPRTKSQKKSDNPLIDTGRMRQSVQYELSRDL
jgi:hypothetical protein